MRRMVPRGDGLYDVWGFGEGLVATGVTRDEAIALIQRRV